MNLESELHPEVYANSSITVHPIARTPGYLKTESRLLFLLLGPLKVLHQILSLWLVLGYNTKPAKTMLVQVCSEVLYGRFQLHAHPSLSFTLLHSCHMTPMTGHPICDFSTRYACAESLQNPPSIPTLLVARVVCYLRDTSLVIDWHNLGYSVLALRLGTSHPLVHVSRFLERYFSRSASAHLAVSEVMARFLKCDFRLSAPIVVLHDRPASCFQPLSPERRLAFLGRLPETAAFINEIEKQRLRVLVSSTSWTPDEDFSILLDALVGYSELATTSHPQLPELMVIITGKGPQKDQYLAKIASLEDQDKLEMVTLKTAWLSTADYASLLGSADLGISLHMSSSGIDLPMKVVDMFGAGLPVIGWAKYEAWPELVQEGINGKGFGSIEELQNILVDLLGGEREQLQKLRLGAVMESRKGWDAEWTSVAAKLFASIR